MDFLSAQAALPQDGSDVTSLEEGKALVSKLRVLEATFNIFSVLDFKKTGVVVSSQLINMVETSTKLGFVEPDIFVADLRAFDTPEMKTQDLINFVHDEDTDVSIKRVTNLRIAAEEVKKLSQRASIATIPVDVQEKLAETTDAAASK